MHQCLLQRDPFKIDTWLVAAYVRQCKNATKSGARRAFASLKWLDRCCDTPKWAEEPMVLAQIKNNSLQEVVMPKVKEGKMPSSEMIFAMEQCTSKKEGRSIIVQVYDGLFCLAIMCSCRGSDCQRTQNMRLTKDALTGESRMKSNRCCIQWAIPLIGLSGTDWITPWLQALTDCGLPGRDFIALGLRKNGSEWGKHPAEYCDMEMMYHYILMNELRLTAKDAAEYSIHGLKHFLITAATQLEVERTTIEKLGHWHHGSKMPDKYNQSKCVQELSCRTKIQQQFLVGWRPVGGSELANEWIQMDAEFEKKTSKNLMKKAPKSFICKFSQAKLKTIARRRAKANRTSSRLTTVKSEQKMCEPAVLTTQENCIIDKTTPCFTCESVNDIKGEVSKSFQAWIRYPETIKNNKYRVVMSDSKTHYFNGFDESYCSTYTCGTVENKRPGVLF